MTRLVPTLPPHGAFGAGEYAEVALLQTLELGLSGAYTLFHSVDWSRGVGEQEQHGAIDIVVVNQAGGCAAADGHFLQRGNDQRHRGLIEQSRTVGSQLLWQRAIHQGGGQGRRIHLRFVTDTGALTDGLKCVVVALAGTCVQVDEDSTIWGP